MRWLAPVLALVGGLGWTAAASAATIEVPGDFNTIQAAVDSADPGDTVAVSKKYNIENVEANVADLTIKGVGRGVVIDGFVEGSGNDYNVEALADGVTIRNLELRHGTGFRCQGFNRCAAVEVTWAGQSTFADCFYASGNRASVKSSKMRGCGDDGIEVSGSNPVVRANSIQRVGGGCIIVAGDDAVVAGNRVSGCEDDDGIQVSGARALVEENLADGVQYSFVRIAGPDAVVRDNEGISAQSYCFSITSAGGSVLGNSGRNCGNHGIDADAPGMVIKGNRITNANADGIRAAGANAKVLANRVAEAFGEGIRASAPAPTIKGNTVSRTGETNILYSCSLDCGDATISRNTLLGNTEGNYALLVSIGIPEDETVSVVGNDISGASDSGVRLDADDSEVLNNTVRSSAFEHEPAFGIAGDRNIVSGNEAISNGGDGFRVDGVDNELSDNLARENGGDGFYVDPGKTNNVLEENRAVKNLADGFENDGTNTVLRQNRASGNRRDCANDGTIATNQQNECADGSDFALPGTASRRR